MLAHGAEHASTRETLLSALGGGELQRHRETIAAVAEQAVATWPTGEPVALHPRLRQLTLEILLRLLLGDPDGPLPAQTLALRDAILSMLEVTRLPLLTETYMRSAGPGRRAWRRFLRDRQRVDGMLLGLIERRRELERPSGLIDVLACRPSSDGSPPSPREVRDNVMSVILAGHETTAAQLAWGLQLLAHNPRAQRRLAAEIDDGAQERYLRATVLETLRHRPVFVFGIP